MLKTHEISSYFQETFQFWSPFFLMRTLSQVFLKVLELRDSHLVCQKYLYFVGFNLFQPNWNLDSSVWWIIWLGQIMFKYVKMYTKWKQSSGGE